MEFPRFITIIFWNCFSYCFTKENRKQEHDSYTRLNIWWKLPCVGNFILTPCCRFLFEKPKAPYVVSKFPVFSVPRRFIAIFKRAQSLVFILCQIILFPIFKTYSFKSSWNIILPAKLISLRQSVPFRYFGQNIVKMILSLTLDREDTYTNSSLMHNRHRK